MREKLVDRLGSATIRRIADLSDRFEQDVLEQALRQNPNDFESLVRLGELYSRAGRSEDGLTVDLQLVLMAPSDPIVRYNLACSLAMTRQVDASVAALREAIRLGYVDVDHLMNDPDLSEVRKHARFDGILRLLQRATRRRGSS